MRFSRAPQVAGSPPETGRAGDDNTSAEARRRNILELARAQHEDEGQVEIDDNAQLSEGTDNGCYAQAWVWVDFTGTTFDKEKGNPHE